MALAGLPEEIAAQIRASPAKGQQQHRRRRQQQEASSTAPDGDVLTADGLVHTRIHGCSSLLGATRTTARILASAGRELQRAMRSIHSDSTFKRSLVSEYGPPMVRAGNKLIKAYHGLGATLVDLAIVLASDMVDPLQDIQRVIQEDTESYRADLAALEQAEAQRDDEARDSRQKKDQVSLQLKTTLNEGDKLQSGLPGFLSRFTASKIELQMQQAAVIQTSAVEELAIRTEQAILARREREAALMSFQELLFAVDQKAMLMLKPTLLRCATAWTSAGQVLSKMAACLEREPGAESTADDASQHKTASSQCGTSIDLRSEIGRSQADDVSNHSQLMEGSRDGASSSAVPASVVVATASAAVADAAALGPFGGPACNLANECHQADHSVGAGPGHTSDHCAVGHVSEEVREESSAVDQRLSLVHEVGLGEVAVQPQVESAGTCSSVATSQQIQQLETASGVASLHPSCMPAGERMDSISACSGPVMASLQQALATAATALPQVATPLVAPPSGPHASEECSHQDAGLVVLFDEQVGSLGFEVCWGGQWPRVRHLMPGGAAQQVGVRHDDALLEINGSSTLHRSREELIPLLRSRPLQLVLAREEAAGALQTRTGPPLDTVPLLPEFPVLQWMPGMETTHRTSEGEMPLTPRSPVDNCTAAAAPASQSPMREAAGETSAKETQVMGLPFAAASAAAAAALVPYGGAEPHLVTIFEENVAVLGFEVRWTTPRPIVGHILPGGAAHQRGIRPGDVLIEINGADTWSHDREILMPLLKARPLRIGLERYAQLSCLL